MIMILKQLSFDKIIKKTTKLFAISFLAGNLLLHTLPPVYADDTPPAAPTAPSQPTAPTQPEQPPPREHHDQPQQPTQPNNPPPNNQDRQAAAQQYVAQQNANQQSTNHTQSTNPSPQPAGANATNNTGTGNAGNSNVTTGSGNNNTTVITNANNNLSANPAQGGTTTTSNSGSVAENAGNGAGSNNAANAQQNNNNTINQNNTGVVGNNLTQSTVTGKNDTSLNVGDAKVKTGDANTSGTAITSLNTNVNGVAVNEFNVNDNHTGDIVLDFTSHCISGCGADSANVVKNVANGTGSSNDASTSNANNHATFQNNDAAVGNTLTLQADSGNNNASDNTGGNTTVQTGNANVEANALTFANDNINGRVIYTTVNIYGNVVGDIVMPQQAMDAVSAVCATCGGQTTTANAGNGAGSINNANTNGSNNNSSFQNNDTDITNNLQLSSTTGNNHENNDTSGNAIIQTGQNTVDSKILNVANMNINGGDMWLVIINEAGNWIGKILGAPDGAHSAASDGVSLTTDAKGNVQATNGGNGAGSTNNANASSNTNNTTSQNNKAKIVNNLNLSANTGNNNASDNTGGNANIKTGNAHIIANLVNFVNNNITNGGKLFVTVVNVFGTWMGNFVSPGQQKQTSASTPVVQSVIPTPLQAATINAATTVLPQYATTLSQNLYHQTPTRRYASPLQNQQAYLNSVGANNKLAALNVYQTLPQHSQAVAGARTEANITRINLAWVLLGIPFYGIYEFFRKKFSPKN